MARLKRGLLSTTVTFLEMPSPPKSYPPLPINRSLTLLRTKKPPLHFYRYLIDRVGREWHWVNTLRLTDDELTAQIHAPERDIRVLYCDGAPAGFFDVKFDGNHAAEIAFFGLMSHVAGQGLGRWFLGAAIEAAWSHHPSMVKLQTCTLDHPAALPLYQKLGFVPVARVEEKVKPLTVTERSRALFI